MIAKTRFLKQGNMIEKDESFSVSTEALAQEFEGRKLAERVGGDENKAYSPETKEEGRGTPTTLNDLTVKDLRIAAREQGIEGTSNMTKAELVTTLEAAQRGE